MRQLILKNVGRNISDEIIATTEKELGVKIPLIYKDFLKQNNGGDR
jgi:hypothetical protein